MYVTNFVPSRLWWMPYCGFNGMKYIFIQVFVHVDIHLDYTIRFCGQLGLNFIVFEFE